MVGIEMNRTLDRTKLMTRSSAGTGKRGVRCDRLNPGFEDSGHKEIDHMTLMVPAPYR